jgi:hypothetical protein
MEWGGARTGSGRKPKAQLSRISIRRAERMIRDPLPEIVDALLVLALGVTVQQTDPKKGETVRVYTRAPDFTAAAYLMDRIMGKPRERSERDTRLSEADSSSATA